MKAANTVSLDVVAIGITWQSYVGVQLVGESPRPVKGLILGLTIWLIYTMDRWLDARKLDAERLHTLRHRFHFEYRRGLLVTWIVALAIDAMLVAWQLSPGELRLAVLGTAAVLIYMVCVHLLPSRSKRYVGKELAVGPLFAFGVFIPTLVQRSDATTWGCWFALAMLYLINCILVAEHDRNADVQQGMPSIVSHRFLPRPTILAIIAGYLAFVVILVMFASVTPRFAATLIFATGLMTLVFGIVSRDESIDLSGWFDLAVILAPLLALITQL